MRPELEFDLGTASVLNEFRREACDIQDEVNTLAIPYKGLHCFAVAMILTEKKGVRWIATLSRPHERAFWDAADDIRSKMTRERADRVTFVLVEGQA
jgi:hypothetical protein